MNNVLIYFCANVQILIRPGTIVLQNLTLHRVRSTAFPRFDLCTRCKPRIFQYWTTRSARGPIFLQDSTAHPTRAPYFSKIRPRTPARGPIFLQRFDRTPGAGRIFGKYSIHVYPVAPRSQSVHSLPILQPHEHDTLLPFLHTNGLLRFSGQI